MKLFNDLEAEHGLPNGLLNAVMKQESGGNTRAVSPKGARGAFQFMPATAKQYGVDVNDLTSSAKGAARMYADLLKQNGGDLNKALAGYNWGQGNVQRKGLDAMPTETRQYIQKVTANMQPANDPREELTALRRMAELEDKAAQAPQATAPQSDRVDFSLNADKVKSVGQGIKDAVGGVARSGMGIASNVLRPFEAMIPGGDDGSSGHKSRMARVEGRFKSQGYDPESAAFQGGKLGGDIAATLPVGGALGKLASKAPTLQSALRTGGLTTGNNLVNVTRGAKALDMGTRVTGGAVTGGAMAGMVDTDSVGTGALIGGALPPGLKLAGEAGKLLKKGTGGIVKHGLGMTTGTGAESVSAAYNAGKNKSTAFLDNMRGNVPFDDVVNQAKGALNAMRMERGNAYRSGMVDIASDKAVVDFKPISEAVSKISQMGSYKGQQINKNAAGTVSELSETINKWSSLDPAEYHTPEGLDALKQAIGDIRDTTQFGTAARRSADAVYNAVKDQITDQAPTYAKVMKDYSEASAALQETEKALSLGNKASADTAIRKLQSLMRNNVQTSYGNRLGIAKNLEEKGGAELLPAIAGQSMNALMPRGITGAIQKGGAVLTAAGTGGASIVPTLLAAPFASPRLIGESLYGLGRLTGAASAAAGKGGNALSKITAQHPELLENSKNALYRSAPVIAISANRGSQR